MKPTRCSLIGPFGTAVAVAVYAALLGFMLPRTGLMKYMAGPIVWPGAWFLSLMAWSASKDPTDLVAMVAAEDKHYFKGHQAR